MQYACTQDSTGYTECTLFVSYDITPSDNYVKYFAFLIFFARITHLQYPIRSSRLLLLVYRIYVVPSHISCKLIHMARWNKGRRFMNFWLKRPRVGPRLGEIKRKKEKKLYYIFVVGDTQHSTLVLLLSNKEDSQIGNIYRLGSRKESASVFIGPLHFAVW